MQSLKTEIGAEIRGPKGVLIRRVPFQPCHSLLKGFMQILASQMGHMNQTIKPYTGIDVTDGVDSWNLAVDGTTHLQKGIVIGSGEVSAVTMEDYVLETQLTTNIAHATVAFAVENPDSETWRLAISRGFTNNTGASVVVKEVGLMANFGQYGYVLIDRTLCAVSFEAGETLTMTYRISISL